MMELEEALFEYLSEEIDCNLYPGALPQQAPDHAATYNRDSTQFGHDLDGACAFTPSTWTIEVRARTLAECYATADLIRAAMHGLSGDMAGRNVDVITLANESDSYVDPVHATDAGFYLVSLNLEIVYPEDLA